MSATRGKVSVDDQAIGLARAQLEKAIDLLDSTPSASAEGVVHQVRKRIKKVRAWVGLVKRSVGKKAVGGVDRRLRDASRPLSAVRDASALLDALDRLETRSLGLVASEPFQEARARLESHKAAVGHALLDEGQVMAQTRKSLRSARRRMALWDLEGRQGRSLANLEPAYRRGRQAFRTAQAEPSVENLHELRKRAKALGYQLRILGDDAGPAAVRLRLRAGLLADELGEGHDLDLLREFLAGHETSGPILLVLDRRRLDLRRGAIQRAGVIFQARPKAFLRSLKRPKRRTVPA